MRLYHSKLFRIGDYFLNLNDELYSFSDIIWCITSCIPISRSPTDFMKSFRATYLPNELSVKCPTTSSKASRTTDDIFVAFAVILLNTVMVIYN